jgi:hypothetical protein
VDFDPEVLVETDAAITLGWPDIAGQEGYVPTIDGSETLTDGKRHAGTSKTVRKVTIGKVQDDQDHDYGVQVLGAVAQGSVRRPKHHSPSASMSPSPSGSRSSSASRSASRSPSSSASSSASPSGAATGTVLPVIGFSPGAIAHAWSSTERTFAFEEMRKAAQNRPLAVRIDATSAGTGSSTVILVDACLAYGLTPYLCLYGTTGPRQADSLGHDLAARYKGKGLVFTGPNEPDLHGWTPAQLVQLQRLIYASVKSGDPAALCGFGALWKGNSGSTGPQAFIQELVTNGRGYADFASFHGYDDPTVHATWCIWDYWFKGGSIASTCQGILEQAGWRLPIVSDECGGKASSGEAAQAAFVHKLLAQAPTRALGVFIFSLLRDYDPDWYVITDAHVETQAYREVVAKAAQLPTVGWEVEVHGGDGASVDDVEFPAMVQGRDGVKAWHAHAERHLAASQTWVAEGQCRLTPTQRRLIMWAERFAGRLDAPEAAVELAANGFHPNYPPREV